MDILTYKCIAQCHVPYVRLSQGSIDIKQNRKVTLDTCHKRNSQSLVHLHDNCEPVVQTQLINTVKS